MSGGRFRVIPGGQPSKPKRPRSSAAKTVWECRICEPVAGARSRLLTKVRQGAVEDARGRIGGGREIWVCAVCLTQGVITPATS